LLDNNYIARVAQLTVILIASYSHFILFDRWEI